MRSNRPQLRFLVLLALLCTARGGHAAATTPTPDFRTHWASELVRLQSWPAQAERTDDSIIFCGERLRTCQMRCRLGGPATNLPPVLYLLDRPNPEAFTTRDTHDWALLDSAALLTAKPTRVTPDPQQQPFHEAVLTAVRALDLLTHSGSRPRRLGLVGEGRGAALALAVAALRPADVAFLCAFAPSAPAQQYASLPDFAALVRAPTLLAVGATDRSTRADTTQSVYEALTCRKELAVLAHVRQCDAPALRQWTTAWQNWTGAALGYQ